MKRKISHKIKNEKPILDLTKTLDAKDIFANPEELGFKDSGRPFKRMKTNELSTTDAINTPIKITETFHKKYSYKRDNPLNMNDEDFEAFRKEQKEIYNRCFTYHRSLLKLRPDMINYYSEGNPFRNGIIVERNKFKKDLETYWNVLKVSYCDTERLQPQSCAYHLILKVIKDMDFMITKFDKFIDGKLERDYIKYYYAHWMKMEDAIKLFKVVEKDYLIKFADKTDVSLEMIVEKSFRKDNLKQIFLGYFTKPFGTLLKEEQPEEVSEEESSKDDDVPIKREIPTDKWMNKSVLKVKRPKTIGRLRHRIKYKKAVHQYNAENNIKIRNDGKCYQGENRSIRADVIRSIKHKHK